MVEECCKYVEQTPDLETKLKLIDTLRTVTEGKVNHTPWTHPSLWFAFTCCRSMLKCPELG